MIAFQGRLSSDAKIDRIFSSGTIRFCGKLIAEDVVHSKCVTRDHALIPDLHTKKGSTRGPLLIHPFLSRV
jgi:hypothetical protein